MSSSTGSTRSPRSQTLTRSTSFTRRAPRRGTCARHSRSSLGPPLDDGLPYVAECRDEPAPVGFRSPDASLPVTADHADGDLSHRGFRTPSRSVPSRRRELLELRPGEALGEPEPGAVSVLVRRDRLLHEPA